MMGFFFLLKATELQTMSAWVGSDSEAYHVALYP